MPAPQVVVSLMAMGSTSNLWDGTMASPCIECGNPVSDTVKQCPHCRTEAPRGV